MSMATRSTATDLLEWSPHVHALVSRGGWRSTPTITSVLPSVAPSGERLTIRGTGFFFSVEVFFDGVIVDAHAFCRHCLKQFTCVISSKFVISERDYSEGDGSARVSRFQSSKPGPERS